MPEDRSFRDQRVTLTEAGEQVLSGERDWLHDHVLDRHLGGWLIHDGQTSWRWDEHTDSVVRVTAPDC